MNYLEALRSGKRYRRDGWSDLDARKAIDELDPNDDRQERQRDMLATDWEILEEKITVTREQVEKAWAWAETAATCTNQIRHVRLVDVLKALGFK